MPAVQADTISCLQYYWSVYSFKAQSDKVYLLGMS